MTQSLAKSTAFRATTALTLSLSLLQPTTALGQAAGNGMSGDDENLAQICAVDPGAEGCEDFLLQMELCAEAPELEGCDALLNQNGDDAAEDEAPEIGVPEESTPPNAPDATLPAAPEDDAEADTPEADAADADTQTDAADTEAEAEADAQPEAEAADTEAEAEADALPEAEAAEDGTLELPEGDEAEPEIPTESPVEEPETDAPVEEPAPETPEPAPAPEAPVEDPAPDAPDEVPAPTAPIEDPAPDAPDAPAPDEAPDAPAPDEAPDTELPPVDTPVEAGTPGAPEGADEAADAQAEAEADAEAEALADMPEGTEAPEVSEAPEEPFEPEIEAAPEPTEEEQQAIQRMMEDPEVSSAIDTLNRALGLAEEPAAPATADDTAQEAETTGEATTETAAPADGMTGALPAAAVAALAAALAGRDGQETTEAAGVEPEDVTVEELTEENSRSSSEEFETNVVTQTQTQTQREERRGLSNLERAGLVALGAVGVGMLVGNNRVVANSGDRVVVDRGNGDLAVWKDDDALIRQPGATQRTQRFNDGSTLTTMDRADGSQIITIRDATGRVLRRERMDPDGTSVQLIDDTRQVEPVQVSLLPPPRMGEVQITERTDTDMLRALLAEAEAEDLGRTFSLRQVRETRELRELSPEISAEPITFATASSAVRTEEARKLVQLGRLMQEMIADNPREVFLIEGHTDAVGSASYNLALSDRRAESVALAMTEYFGVRPENMVVQGYGKRFLKVPTLAAEPANRRVAVRRITWLIQ